MGRRGRRPIRRFKKPWFLAAFFGHFLSLVKESDPSETCPAKRKIPPDYTGAHKKVISEITIMASIRRGW